MEHAVSGIRQKDSLWLSEKQADYTFEPDRCGEWKLTITEVRIYDFIGILSVGKKQQEKERFTVLPKICAMPVEIGRRTREFRLSRKPIPMKGVGRMLRKSIRSGSITFRIRCR